MSKQTILIVDDEVKVSQLLYKVLGKEGFITLSANSGKEALDLIDRHKVDLVISDINMPGMTGVELLKRIRDLDSSIKVILITAYATLETAIEAIRMGASDYITKPFDIDEIIQTVKKCLTALDIANVEPSISLRDGVTDSLIISKNPAMLEIINLIRQVAETKSTVMIHGETGTGKELVAQALHNLSSRKDKPFIKTNCAAIPETLLESELFGYERGAFTGAVSRKPGRFELAEGGSIFLDEIGDMPMSLQAKLLRVIQEKEFERLGGLRPIKFDVRIITATNKDLEALVKEGTFRDDLFYRLNVVPISLPPLRKRKEDINFLIDHFLAKSAAISQRPVKRILQETRDLLQEYPWPGNIRELENIIERCVVVSRNDCLITADLPEKIRCYTGDCQQMLESDLDQAIDKVEIQAIQKALKNCQGNRTKAAEQLGISRRSLHRKISKYGLE